MTRRATMLLVALLVSAAAHYGGRPRHAGADELPPAAKSKVDFDKHVRPIFAKRCFSCHGPDEAEGSLRLDVKVEAFRGGNSGPAFEPGDSAASRLVQYVAGTSDDGLVMPPEGEPLSAEEIGILRAWIDQGAVWPEQSAQRQRKSDHWAFQPLRRIDPPDVASEAWVRNPIDAFVLARLESLGIAPSPEADRPTLVRRLSLDLTGLLPAPEEVERFVADRHTDAYERLVDRLLSSPHYGERWGRHWLDLARYADSDGYEKDRPRPHAWRYRQWVIDALNRDLPFDQFTRDQLAGDLIAGDDRERLVATGFHRNTLTNREGGVDQEEFRVAATVDRVNTTGAVWLGLTLGCAQCHSHKYDPISQREYYGLFAFFNNVEEEDLPAPLAEQVAEYEAARKIYEAEHAALVAALEAYQSGPLPARQRAWESKAGQQPDTTWQPLDVLKATADAKGLTLEHEADGAIYVSGAAVETATYTIVARTMLEQVTALRLEALTDPRLEGQGPGRGAKGAFGVSEVRLTLAPSDPAAAGAGQPPRQVRLVEPQAGVSPEKSSVAMAVDGDAKTAWSPSPQWGRDHVATFELAEAATLAGGTQLTITLEQKSGGRQSLGRFRLSVTADAVPVRSPGTSGAIAEWLKTPAAQRSKQQQAEIQRYYRQHDAQWVKLNAAVEQHARRAPVDPATQVLAQALVERKEPRSTHILVRGDFLRPGAEVQAHTPEVLHPLGCGQRSANRVDLADWLVDPANPLTPRVTVNRMWQKHFGRGLVPTENDFGTQGEPPSHPELLDWLAAEFIAQGWSMKQMHRLIVTSATYRQSSEIRPDLVSRDPYNGLLARQQRLRVEAEVIRDLTLSASGLLDRRVGGPSVRPPQPAGISELTYANSAKWVESKGGDRFRRGMYTFFQRTSPYPMLMTFDAPDSNVTCTRRERSNTPLQALTLLNDAVFFECAQALGRRIVGEAPLPPSADPDAVRDSRLVYAYRLCLARPPRPQELQVLRRLYDAQLALCRSQPERAGELVGTAQAPQGAAVSELAAWTMVGRTLLNLDEFITRE